MTILYDLVGIVLYVALRTIACYLPVQREKPPSRVQLGRSFGKPLDCCGAGYYVAVTGPGNRSTRETYPNANRGKRFLAAMLAIYAAILSTSWLGLGAIPLAYTMFPARFSAEQRPTFSLRNSARKRKTG